MQLRPVEPQEDLEALEELFEVIVACDGHHPIGEHKYLDLLRPSPDRLIGLVGEEGGEVVSYVALSPTADEEMWGMELALHPLHRSRGEIERSIDGGLRRIREAGGRRVRVWCFLPRLAEALEGSGLRPERELRQLRRRLPVEERPRFPEGLIVRGFRPGVDEEAWLEVNNAAFEGHPENGSWTREILEDRERQDWFDPDGFRMAWEGERLVGFCWTKVHREEETAGENGTGGVGEIYVIAVNPDDQGRGLGKALVLEGLRHLWEVEGVASAMLYVDADNQRGLALYDRLGFRLDHVDRSFVGPV